MEKSFRNLKVWQKAHESALDIYKITTGFPQHETYGLISQIRRSAVSVPANIAEGNARNSTKQYINFLSIARGSLSETMYYLILAYDLKYINKQEYEILYDKYNEVARIMNAMISTLKQKELNDEN